MNKIIKQLSLSILISCLSVYLYGQQESVFVNTDKDPISFPSQRKLKKELKKWDKFWIKTLWEWPLILPQLEDFNNKLVINYLRIYPDTLTNKIHTEHMKDKLAILTHKKNIFYWYNDKKSGLGQLAIGAEITKELKNELDSIGKQHKLYLIYLIPDERDVFSKIKHNNLPMVIGYSENGEDLFLDNNNTYNSIDEMINARYESIEKYIEFYKRGYSEGEIEYYL